MQVFVVTEKSPAYGYEDSIDYTANIFSASTQQKAQVHIDTTVATKLALRLRGYTRGNTEYLNKDYDKRVPLEESSLRDNYDIEELTVDQE